MGIFQGIAAQPSAGVMLPSPKSLISLAYRGWSAKP